MTEVHYGVVRTSQGWSLIGDALRVPYSTRGAAERAARRLAEQSTGIGIPVQMHMQDEDGQLRRPQTLS